MTDPTPGDNIVTVRDKIVLLQAQITALVETLQGSRDESFTTLADALFTQGNPRSPYLSAINGRLESIEERLDTIQAGIGAEPYNSLELATVRGMLWSLVSAQNAARYGWVPNDNGDASSIGEVIGMGRVYAKFTPPIEGVVIDGDGVNLTAQWGDGWEVYIQTTDPLPQINTDPTYPNRWIALDYVGAVNFSVAPAYTIKVFLRAPVLYGTCYAATGMNNVSTSWAPVWAGAPWNMTNFPTNPNRYVFIQYDIVGWTFVNSSGTSAQVYGWASPYNGSLAINETVAAGGMYKFTYQPSYFYIEAGANNPPNLYKICAPVPSPS